MLEVGALRCNVAGLNLVRAAIALLTSLLQVVVLFNPPLLFQLDFGVFDSVDVYRQATVLDMLQKLKVLLYIKERISLGGLISLQFPLKVLSFLQNLNEVKPFVLRSEKSHLWRFDLLGQ